MMLRRRSGRRPEPRITDPTKHPRKSVGMRVAAEYLGVDERTVRARIDTGEIEAWRDGKVYRIDVAALERYLDQRRRAS